MRLPCPPLILLLLCWGLMASDSAIGGTGYRYDGTGLAPSDWKPPTSGFDGATGKGVRWKIPTANWGYACPVEVGDQVLVLCEPGTEELLWPTLVSYDRKTGSENWRTAIDPLLPHKVSDAERKQIEGDWAFFHETWRFLYSTAIGFGEADAAKRKAIDAKLQTRDFSMTKWKKGYGLLRYLKYNNARFKEVKGKYSKTYGLKTATWQAFEQARVGTAFPTPISDGEHIVAITMMGTVACLDMSGKLLWIHDTGYRQPGNAGTASSPRIADGKALFSMSSQTWAYDLKTGKMLWTVGKPGDKWVNGHGVYASPVVMDIDGTLVLIDGKSRVIRISDGRVLDLVDSKGKPLPATQPKKGKLVDPMRIANPNYLPFTLDRAKQEIFIAGKSHFSQFELTPFPDHFKKMKAPSLVGYNLQYASDTVTVTPTKLQVLGGQGGVAFGDKLYIPGQIINRETLEGASAHKKAPTHAAKTRHIFMLANGHTYGMKEEYKKGSNQTGCTITVYDLNGKKAHEATLPWIDPAKDSHVRAVWDQGITKTNYACSMNLGRDCLYARDSVYLYCFGK